ncbi:hypothetical protein B4102_0710 [Heyndrickxia sporothermodurans]|uniref:Uncharacterized protein n=1 Tax=Heyndrickxia sporothermodurans TaxID=46224 RepID=A0A150L8R0_9BACI|nr:hypothetical protein B4102_0710 [Heyndrickxia sporothermodurans]
MKTFTLNPFKFPCVNGEGNQVLQFGLVQRISNTLFVCITSTPLTNYIRHRS